MNLIAPLLAPTNIIVGLDASSKKRVFEHAGLMFENHQGLARSVIYDALFAREKLGSTGLGQGVAIPHGRIAGLEAVRGLFVRLAQPVAFDSADGKPVDLVFMLLAPEEAGADHLHALATVSRTLRNAGVCEQLRKAKDAAAISALFASTVIGNAA